MSLAPRILFWPRLALARDETLQALRAEPGLDLGVVDTLPQLLTELPRADALVLHSAPVETARTVVGALGRVRWMHFLTAGRDGFEAAGLPRSVQVTHVAGASAPTVAEHAMALLLALGRRIPTAVQHARERLWDRRTMGRYASLEGTRVAVLGTGAIGREVARRVQAFGAAAVGISRTGTAQADFAETHKVDDLQRAVSDCQALVVAVPLTDATRRLVDARVLAALPPGAVVVNVARGAVIDQAALCDALASGHLGGAGLDVTDPEPPALDDRLWKLDNLLVTPHVAIEGSPATARRIARGTLDNVRRFVAGQDLADVAAR